MQQKIRTIVVKDGNVLKELTHFSTFSLLALQVVPELSDELRGVFYSTTPDIHIFGWCEAVTKWSGAMLCAAGKWLSYLHLYCGSGEKVHSYVITVHF